MNRRKKAYLELRPRSSQAIDSTANANASYAN